MKRCYNDKKDKRGLVDEKTFFLLVLGLFCLFHSVFAIDFKINSYQGDLYIHADNTQSLDRR